jgi:hypothetical protein
MSLKQKTHQPYLVTWCGHMTHKWSHDKPCVMTQLGIDFCNQLGTGLVCFTYFTPRTVADRLKIDKPENWLMNRGRWILWGSSVGVCVFLSDGSMVILMECSQWCRFSCHASNLWEDKNQLPNEAFLIYIVSWVLSRKVNNEKFL